MTNWGNYPWHILDKQKNASTKYKCLKSMVFHKCVKYSNYQTWKFKMKMILMKNNVQQLCDPSYNNIKVHNELAYIVLGRVL